ncbi:MAG: transcription antitermination factor NusB [Acidimicrobiales bacterium]
MPTGTRRESRERALALLYEAEAKDMSPHQVLAQLPVAPEPFVIELVSGVEAESERIDAILGRLARDWTLGRMPWIDRNVLRLATYELLTDSSTPIAAVINEAVELAKAYSTEASGRFVNGILAAIAAEVRPN